MYVYVMAVGWFNKWSYDVAHQDGMSFAVLSYIYCCLLILMWIFRTSAVTDTNLFLQSKTESKYLRKQSVDTQ